MAALRYTGSELQLQRGYTYESAHGRHYAGACRHRDRFAIGSDVDVTLIDRSRHEHAPNVGSRRISGIHNIVAYRRRSFAVMQQLMVDATPVEQT